MVGGISWGVPSGPSELILLSPPPTGWVLEVSLLK